MLPRSGLKSKPGTRMENAFWAPITITKEMASWKFTVQLNDFGLFSNLQMPRSGIRRNKGCMEIVLVCEKAERSSGHKTKIAENFQFAQPSIGIVAIIRQQQKKKS